MRLLPYAALLTTCRLAPPNGTPLRNICGPSMAESELTWRKRMAEQKDCDPAEEECDVVVSKQQPDMSSSVDDMDFFGGAGGGGTLTTEGIKNAQRTRSKSIDAMDELQEAVKVTGSMPPAEAAVELQRVIGNAYEAGVSVTNPQMRRAAALLSALEAASATAESDDTNTVVGPDAGLDEKLDALFGGFAPPPDLEL